MVHVRVAWYGCMTLGARTGHLYDWKTRGTRVGRFVCLYDTWCTYESIVCLEDTWSTCTCNASVYL